MEAGYPGENGAQAIAEVLFGDYNPAGNNNSYSLAVLSFSRILTSRLLGRLTVTVYPANYVNQVPLTNMSMRAAVNNPGRTYRYFKGQVPKLTHFPLTLTTIFPLSHCGNSATG